MANDIMKAKKRSMNSILITLYALFLLTVLSSQPEENQTILEIRELREQIQHHDHLYYRANSPVISDQNYDLLRKRLDDLENKWPSLAEKAGDELPQFGDDRINSAKSHTHRTPMLSLKKCYTDEDVTRFYQQLVDEIGDPDLELRLEPKIDGVAISAIYENGTLMKVLTRGDGQKGGDITRHILRSGCLPERLTDNKLNPAYLELRGEAYIPLSEFKRINSQQIESGGIPYVSPRNLAAGTLRLKDVDSVRERRLKVVIFSFGAWVPEKRKPSTEGEFREILLKWGVPIVQSVEKIRGISELLDRLETLSQDRLEWDYPTDGIVMEVENIVERDRLGLTSQGPRWAAAFKFPSATARTVLVGIEWQTGATGKVTPVALLKPVLIDGRKVERANLYNEEYIVRNNLRVGDEVTVELKGGVIPLLKTANSHNRSNQ